MDTIDFDKQKIKDLCILSLTIALRAMVDFKNIDKEYRKIYRLLDYQCRVECKNRFEKIEDAERAEAFRIIMKFGDASGWVKNGKKLHPLTIASFLLDIIDHENYNPGIVKTLNKLVSKFEDDGEMKALCLKAGEIAADKWRKLIDDYENEV